MVFIIIAEFKEIFKRYFREDKDFAEGIREYAKQYFSISLLTEEEASTTPSEFEDLT